MGVRCAFGSRRRWVATSGVWTLMVRIFGILKILLLLPTRSDQYRTGPLEVSFTARAIRSIGRTRSGDATSTRARSKKRFATSPILPLRCACARLSNSRLPEYGMAVCPFRRYSDPDTIRFTPFGGMTNKFCNPRTIHCRNVASQLRTVWGEQLLTLVVKYQFAVS